MLMNVLLLPDFIAMALLVGVLLLVRSKRSDSIIRMWTAGLLLILLECAARLVYSMALPRGLHLVVHALALNCYGLAGALFLRSASRVLRRVPGSRLFLWSNLLPHLGLFTLYGLEIEQVWPYRICVLLGFAIGLGSSARLRRSWRFYAAFCLVWTPLLICTEAHQFRTAVYLSLFFLYALSATFFYFSLRPGSRGKIAVVAGFGMWAVCFAVHPWVAVLHPRWTEFINQLWNMQKFVITVGLLLVMLEDQIRSNQWLALHDELTGLPNRRLFEDRLQHALIQAERTHSRLALFNLDLDGFKQVNDTLGHDAGDILLKGVTSNLLRSLRRSDTLARVGGDEFALIATELDGIPGTRTTGAAPPAGSTCAAARLPQVLRILSALSSGVEVPVDLGEVYESQTAVVSTSIGVAIYPDEGSTAEELMRLADQRMYLSKAEGVRRRKQKADAYSDYDLQRA
ncbi:MAG: diguanylate cyclase domain-containing protein [Janthinobacterium lividum]